MANGTIALTRTGNGYLSGQILWSSVSNGTAANTSTVTATLQIQRSALNSTTGTFKGTFTVGGMSENISWYGTLPTYEWVTIKTITTTVGHSADGNGSCYLYALVNGPSQTTMEGTSVSGSATVALDAIPRFATLVSVSDFTDESGPVITYSNPAGEAISYLQACLSLDGKSVFTPYKDVPKTGTSYIFPLTEEEKNRLRAATPNANDLKVYVFLLSAIGGSESYPSMAATMRMVNADPTVDPVVVDTNSATIKLTGNSAVLVAQQSKARVTIQAAAKKYASIVSRRVEHGAVVLTDDGLLSPVTNHPIQFAVTDSRGNTATCYAPNTIIPYFNPTCIIGNNIPEAGGKFSLVVTGLAYNGSFGAADNALRVQYRYKTGWGTYPQEWTDVGAVTRNGNSYNASVTLTGLDYKTVYTFQARVIDAVHTNGVLSAEKAVIAEPVFDWGRSDFQFNVPVNLAEDCEILKNGVAAYAPAGYGLGESYCKHISSVEEITQNGYYRIWLDPTKGDPAIGNYTFFAIADASYNNVHLDGKCDGGYIHRDKWDGVWYPWEWVDPPMKIGMEYRTTKRWNGKVVYRQLIHGGSLPASGSIHINIPTTGTLQHILRAEGSLADMRVFPSSVIGGIMKVDLETHRGGIDVYVSHDFLGGSAVYVLVEYTLQ